LSKFVIHAGQRFALVPKIFWERISSKLGFATLPHQSFNVTKGVSWMDGHSVPPAWCSPHATGDTGRVDESTPSFPRRTTLKSRRGSGGMGGAVGWCGPRVVGVRRKVAGRCATMQAIPNVAERLHEGCTKGAAGLCPSKRLTGIGLRRLTGRVGEKVRDGAKGCNLALPTLQRSSDSGYWRA
jgi:hypothetical protein